MMRSKILFFIFIGLLNGLVGQNLSLDWATHIGSNGPDEGSMAIDSNNDIVIAGQFDGTIDLDPTTAVNNLSSTSQDIFFAKYNASGNLIYSNVIGSSGYEIFIDTEIDNQNNIYICGIFDQEIDFDPSANQYLLSPSSIGQQLFVAKYNSSGALIYAKEIDSNVAFDIKCDNTGNLIVLSGLSQIVKLDPAGNILYTKLLDQTPYSNTQYCDIDSANNIYIGGTCTSITDFDFSSNVVNVNCLQDGNQYFAKYDSACNLIYANVIRDDGYGDINSMKLTPNGELVICMNFEFATTIDIDPSPNVLDINSVTAQPYKSAILKYDQNGALLEYKLINLIYGYSSVRVFDVFFKNNGEFILVGDIFGEADFDFGTGVVPIISSNAQNTFIAKYNPDYSIQFANRIKGLPGANAAKKVFEDISGYIYVHEYFQYGCYPNPSDTNQFLASNGQLDFLIAKYNLQSTNIQSVNLKEELIVFPNPIGDYLSIKNLSTSTKLDIYSIEGKFIKTMKATQAHNIKLDELSSGMYFIEFFIDNQTKRLKFIKE